MRLIKSNKIGFLQRSYGIGQDYHYVVSPIVFFNLLDGQLLVEHTQWGKVAKVLGSQSMDEGLPKTTGEFLLAGHAYPHLNDCPDATEQQVSVALGEHCKALNIYGKRQWCRSWLGGCVPSQPEVVLPTALTYENAYGGADYTSNPLGTGFDKDSTLPLIEHPQSPISRPHSKRLPASFLPLSITWPQRAQFNGSFKGNWFESCFPAMPEDTDPRLFNAAQQDQQLSRYFNGDESFRLSNLHEEFRSIEGKLPGVRARTFIRRNGLQEELPSQLDTVWFMPDAQLGALIFRSQVEVVNLEALEVTDVLLAYENLADPLKPVSHYEEVYNLRTAPDSALANCMNESQLAAPESAQIKQQKQLKIEQQKTAKIAALKYRQQKMLETAAPGTTVDIDTLPEPELSPMDDVLDEDVKAGNFDLTPVLDHAQKKVDEAMEQASKKLGDLNSIAQAPSPGRVQKISLQDAQRKFKQSADATSLEQQAMLASQMTYQPQDKVNISVDAALGLRQILDDALNAGQTVNGRDLSGVDLCGQRFTAVDFSQSVFSFAKLTEAEFTDCTFTDCAFANADLTNARFIHCDMVGCNFKGVIAEQSSFTSTDMEKTHWQHANLTQATFSKVKLNSALLLNSTLVRSQFNDVHAEQVTITQCLMQDSDFNRAILASCIFSETNLQFSRWSECQFERVVMQLCNLQLSGFYKLNSHKMVLSTQTDITASCWREVTCQNTSFREVCAARITIEKSTLAQCDFSLADMGLSRLNDNRLLQTIFARTNVSNGRWFHCNCYRSRFRACRFDRALLSECNFLEADLMWAELQHTRIENCINFSKVATRDLKQLERKRA